MYKAIMINEDATGAMVQSVLFDTDSFIESEKALVAQLQQAVNTAGSLSVQIPPQNSCYGEASLLKTWVRLYRDSDLVFVGRLYSDASVFNTCETFLFEGALAVFNDSMITPFTHNGTAKKLVETLIAEHNKQYSAEKQVYIGTISFDNYSDTIYRAYENYETTMSRLMDLHDTYGGYMSMSYVNDRLQFDWVASITSESTQHIDFGTNLLDISQEKTADELITRLIPLGAVVEDVDGNKSRLNIKGASVGAVDYIDDLEAQAIYGVITGTHTWEDITNDSHLLNVARKYLTSLRKDKKQITVTAVDLANAGYSVNHFSVGQKIYVTSAPHGISNLAFVVEQLTINIFDPSSDQLVLNTTVKSFTNSVVARERKANEITNSVEQNYADVNSVAKQISEVKNLAIENTSSIQSNAEKISLSVTKTEFSELGQRVTDAESKIEQTSDTVGIYFGTDTTKGKINTWFEFNESCLKIGKDGEEIHSEQDNNSYRFVDSEGNELLVIAPDAIEARDIDLGYQVRYLNQEENPNWATRIGAFVSGVGNNLNDVWIGG